MAKRIKFPDKPTELKTLRIGDTFTLTRGAPFLEKIDPPAGNFTGLCFARIVGETDATGAALHSFTDSFLVYFIKHKPHAKANRAAIPRGVPIPLFN